MKKFIKDSFVNFVARLGYGAGSQQDASTYSFNYVSRDRPLMEAMYRGNWLAGAAVDCVAEDMTRAGAEIVTELDPDHQQAIEGGMQRLEIWHQLSECIRWSRLYGGCLGVLLIDGQDLSTPLNIDTIGKDQFKGILPLDRWLVTPTLSNLVKDYGPQLGLPKYYDVVADAMALPRMRIHHSRCIRLDGQHLPYWQRIAENLWGQSVLERIYDRIIAFDSATEGAAQLTYKAHLRTYKIPGLREIIGTGAEAMKGLTAQINMIRQMQSNEGITLMDGEDEFEAHQYAFSGLADIILQFGQQVSGAIGVPLVRLFGQSPAGMSATGESDFRNYYDNVGAQQNNRLRTPLHIVYECLSRSEYGKPLPDDFEFAFRALWQMSDVEKSQVAQNVATALTGLEQQGLISHEVVLRELRDLSKSTGIFSSISDEDIEAAKNEPPEPAQLPEVPGLPGREGDPEKPSDPKAGNTAGKTSGSLGV